MGTPQKISQAILAIERANTGYSQGSNPDTGRWSFLKSRTERPLQIRPNRNADCSAAVGAATVIAGYPLALPANFYTGNMRALLTKAGAQDLPFNYNAVQVGDILWRKGHTEIVTSVKPKQQTGARLDENGQIVGGKPGDQTGREFATSPLSSNWTRILRFPTKTQPKESKLSTAEVDEIKKYMAALLLNGYTTGGVRKPGIVNTTFGNLTVARGGKKISALQELADVKTIVTRLEARLEKLEAREVDPQATQKTIRAAVDAALADLSITLTNGAK